MKDRCSLDYETYSACNLKKSGAFRYAQDPTTEILCASYAFNNGPVHFWIAIPVPATVIKQIKRMMDPGAKLWAQRQCPPDLAQWIRQGKTISAHNFQFERVITKYVGPRYGVPEIKIKQGHCTAAKCAAHGLPRALGNAAKALGTAPKDEAGKADLHMICKPRKGTGKQKGKMIRLMPADAPQRYVNVFRYCIDDTKAERDLDKNVPDLSAYEQQVYELDQRINQRGVRVDQQAVKNVQFLIAQYKRKLEGLCEKWTGVKPTQTQKLAEWVRAQGYEISDLQAPTMLVAIKDPNCPRIVRKVLQLRSVHSMKAVAKYTALQNAICLDGRIRGMFLYYGANTGRWSSLIVQLQNLFRSVIKDPNNAIKAYEALDIELIKALYDEDPMKVFASTVRGMLIAEILSNILALDFRAIEARMIAWLAGQKDILAVFRDHGKIYEYTAGQIFNMDWRKIKDPSDERFIGKIASLALGYQGGKAAFAKMAKNYGVVIEEWRAEEIKIKWRAANRKIVKFWYDLEEAAVNAVRTPGAVFAIPNRKIMFKVQGKWLYMRLPSGRRLAYFKPELNDDGQVTYLGIDTYSRRWGRVSTYGGKLAENATQAAARDLMVNGLFGLERAGYEPIGSVHDEAITEIAEGFGSLDEAREIMCRLPNWAEGLPVEAAGFIAKRYRK